MIDLENDKQRLRNQRDSEYIETISLKRNYFLVTVQYQYRYDAPNEQCCAPDPSPEWSTLTIA